MDQETTVKVQRRTKTIVDRCRICGDLAQYNYYGVLACRSCKIFFKRNAENRHKIRRCDAFNNCEVNLRTRHVCATCRLKKCFDCGMEVEKLRHFNRTVGSKAIVSKKLPKALEPIEDLMPTINLLRADISSLTTNQWTLLNNLINHYDTSSLFLIADQLNAESNRAEMNTSLIQHFLTDLYANAGNSFRSNPDLHLLSINDRTLLLPTSVDNTISLAATYIFSQANLHAHFTFINYIQNVYTCSIVDCQRRCSHLAVADYVLFKLILALFILSSNARTCYQHLSNQFQDVKQLLSLEDQYAELTWKYLLYRYPLCDAVHRYDELIRWILSITALVDCGHEAVVHTRKMQSLVEDTEMKLILDDVERITEETETFASPDSVLCPNFR